MNVEIRIDLHFPTDASREMYIVVVISKICKFTGNIKTNAIHDEVAIRTYPH